MKVIIKEKKFKNESSVLFVLSQTGDQEMVRDFSNSVPPIKIQNYGTEKFKKFKPGYKPIRIDDDKSSKAKSQSESSSRVPCYLFFFIVAGCIGFAALSSYVRFSKACFQIDVAVTY